MTFARSQRVVRWSDAQQNLLELAEACDIAMSWSCRSGVCHSCECPSISGAVAYATEPIAMPSDDTVLLCCAHPIKDVELDL
jgi:ferredoxin